MTRLLLVVVSVLAVGCARKPPPPGHRVHRACSAASELAFDDWMDRRRARESPDSIQPGLVAFYKEVDAAFLPAAAALCMPGDDAAIYQRAVRIGKVADVRAASESFEGARPDQVSFLAVARYCAATDALVHRAATTHALATRRDTFAMTVEVLVAEAMPLCRSELRHEACASLLLSDDNALDDIEAIWDGRLCHPELRA